MWALSGLLLSSLAGCSSQPGDADCLPVPLTVSPSPDVVLGQKVTVSSKGFACEPSDRHGLETIVGLGHTLVRVPIRPDGSFTATFQVPADAPVGPTGIIAFGPTMYLCHPGEDCASYAAGFTVRR